MLFDTTDMTRESMASLSDEELLTAIDQVNATLDDIMEQLEDYRSGLYVDWDDAWFRRARNAATHFKSLSVSLRDEKRKRPAFAHLFNPKFSLPKSELKRAIWSNAFKEAVNEIATTEMAAKIHRLARDIAHEKMIKVGLLTEDEAPAVWTNQSAAE